MKEPFQYPAGGLPDTSDIPDISQVSDERRSYCLTQEPALRKICTPKADNELEGLDDPDHNRICIVQIETQG